MQLTLFSSLILRELIKEIGNLREGVHQEIQIWADKMTTMCKQELEEQPVLYLSVSEVDQANEYLNRFRRKMRIDVAENATKLVYGKHVAEIREFLKTKHDGWPVFAQHGQEEDVHYNFPKDDRAPASFKEWFAVTSVWRLALAMPEISYQQATMGTAESLVSPVPESWEEKLEECLRVTEGSAFAPVPKGWDLPLRRRDIDSLLPAENLDSPETGLLTNGIISSWFRILVARREQSQPGCTIFIPPDSLDMVGSTPRVVAEKNLLVNRAIDMVLIPIIIQEQGHCVLVVVYPRKKTVAILNSRGFGSNIQLQQQRPWMKEKHLAKFDDWETIWVECPHQERENACGVFMLINALCLIMVKDTATMYTHQDSMFLRQYVAAVICMGKLPGDCYVPAVSA